MFAFDRAILERDRLALTLAFDRESARTLDTDGRMHVAKCRISKANVCPYYGKEIPNFQALGLAADRVYMLYRHPDELAKSANTFRNLQLLIKHDAVNANDAKTEITAGTVGSEVSFDGMYLVADHLTVWTREGIDFIETEERRELSSSYRYRADMTAGRTPEGVAYDGIMRDIKGNHVALVREGRAGPDVIVSDAALLEQPSMALKRPNLMSRLLLLGVMPAGVLDEPAKLALDAKLADMTARDAECDTDMEDDPENPGLKRKKKMNPGKGEPGKLGGAMAGDEQIAAAVDAKLKEGEFISKADAQKLANDAAAAAVKSVGDLAAARVAVAPLVGEVALDSAEAVYKFALDKEGVALDGVPTSAYAALVSQRLQIKGARNTIATPTVAAQGARDAVSKALPGLLNRFSA